MLNEFYKVQLLNWKKIIFYLPYRDGREDVSGFRFYITIISFQRSFLQKGVSFTESRL